MWFSSISLPYEGKSISLPFEEILAWQYCPHTFPQFCKVYFNVTVPNPNDLWLLLFVGVSNEFGHFLEAGLNRLLAHQLLSINMGVVIISQKIVLNRVQPQMLRCCDSRKHRGWEKFVPECLWLLFCRYFCIQLKTSQSLIFRMENCTQSPDQILLTWLMLGTQNHYSFLTLHPLELPWDNNCLCNGIF